jgi:hypothetical protein
MDDIFLLDDEPQGEPENLLEMPSIEDLATWMEEGGCEATDGCWVEPDGYCEHGFPSWLLYLGLI